MPKFTIKRLINPQHDTVYLDKLFELYERTQKTNSTPYLYPQNQAFFQRNLKGECLNIVAVSEHNIIGYGALRKLDPWPSYLTPTQWTPSQCALMLINLVDPAWRGQGIGQQLCDSRIELARELGFQHLLSTVHPDNSASLAVLKNRGFEIIERRALFEEQLMRCVLHLSL